MRSTIACFASRCAITLVVLVVGAAVEGQAQTVDELASAKATKTAGVTSAPVVRAGTNAEESPEKKTRHLTGVRPQGSLHRYYQEQSRAQAARGIDAPSSRRVVGLDMDANWSASVNNPFTDEAHPSVVTPPDAIEIGRPIDPDSYLEGQELPLAARPPAALP